MNSNARFDLQRFRDDLRVLTTRIVSLKRALRSPWKEPMADSQRDLCQLKIRATQMCALRASTRGRLHRRVPPAGAPPSWDPWQAQARIVERLGPQYEKTLEESA